MRTKSPKKKSLRKRGKSNSIKRRSKKKSHKGGVITRDVCRFGTTKCKQDREDTDNYQSKLIAKQMFKKLIKSFEINKLQRHSKLPLKKNKVQDAEDLLKATDSLSNKCNLEAPNLIKKYTTNKNASKDILLRVVEKFKVLISNYASKWKKSAENYKRVTETNQMFAKTAEKNNISVVIAGAG